MALNFADRMAVLPLLVPRITAVVANYALYILGNDSASTGQKRWARSAILEPESVARSVSKHVLNQPEFIENGSGISDAVLGGACETAINAHFITEEPAA